LSAIVYMVGDGCTDIYGLFSTREKAEAFIQRQRDLGYPFCDSLTIDEWPLDQARDLIGGTKDG
jgi:hypothetical protein